MVRFCVFPNCPNKMTKWSKFSFHALPFRDLDLLKLWLVALKMDPNTAMEALKRADNRVCGAHFAPEDFFPPKTQKEGVKRQRLHLRKNAIPMVAEGTTDTSGVWLAALRETDKQDNTEQHLICEDHFLPEDISKNGVNNDAIPIMPPCLDGPMSMINPWGAESSEEDDQWAAAGDDDFEDEGGDGVPFNTKLSAPEIPRLDPPERAPATKVASGAKKKSLVAAHRKDDLIPFKKFNREDLSLGVLTKGFLELFLKSPDNSLDIRHVVMSLQTRRRRVYDITNVLEGIRLLEKKSSNKYKWIGSCPPSSFMGKNKFQGKSKFQGEMDNLKLVEDTLDTLIKSCARQLFDMTDNLQNSALAYVTHEDIGRLKAFQEQTVIVVKAPEETKLEVPAPKEDSIQVHLKGSMGPIMVMTCDVGTEENSSCFLTLEESRIKTATLHTESSSIQSA